MDKIMYKDGDKNRLLKGKVINEDDYFITLQLTDSTYRISKASIISIRQGIENEEEHV